MLGGFVIFWLSRLISQFFVYDPNIRRGRRFYSIMHVVFSIFWVYAVLTYSAALRMVWNG